MILGVIAGILADKFSVVNMMLANCFMIVVAGGLILADMFMTEGKSITIMYYIGYEITAIMFPVSMLMALILLSKIVNPVSRGTMFGFNSFLGSVFVTLMQLVGSVTFKQNQMILFGIPYGLYFVLCVVIVCV